MTPSKKPFWAAILATIAVCFFAAVSARAVMVTWVGTNSLSATTNWSDENNWDEINTTFHISPENNAANFTFWTAAASPGLVTVNVDGGYDTPGSGLAQSYGAFFGQTNGYHTVFIQPGMTLALQAGALTPGVGMLVGPQPTNNNTIGAVYSPGIAYTNYTTIEGIGGTLFMNSAGLRVEGGCAVVTNHYSILDMSGLGTFIMTNNQQGSSVNIFSNSFIVVDGAPNSQALVYLALTNVITLMDSFQIGYLGTSSNSLPIGVYLGQSNYITTGSITNSLIVGARGCTNGFMMFNPALLGGPNRPTASLSGYGGSQNVTICAANGGVVPGYAVCDLTGGNVTWSINALDLGVSGTGAASANGILSFDSGSITANTIAIGVQTNSGGAPGMGTLNIGANALLQTPNPIVLGSVSGSLTGGTGGTINITGGTLTANSIVTSGGAGTVNMTNATWNVAVTGGVTGMTVTAFNFGGSNVINITSLDSAMGAAPMRFHLISASVSGSGTVNLGSLPVGPDPAHPYKGYIDSTGDPGFVDLVLTGGPFESGADILTDPGFETDPAGPTSTIYGWFTFGNAVSETSTTLGNDGNNYLQVASSLNSATNYNGVYQDYISGPGAVYSASGWGYISSANPLAGQNEAWLEVTFRDVNANILALYRSAIIAAGSVTPNTWINLPITNQYNPTTYVVTNYTSSLVAPAGTSFVRYQVTFQGDAANSPGAVDFDDLTLSQTSGGPYGNWNIVWSDEFNGTSLSTNWVYDIGGGGWGNNELEYYTDFSSNVYVSNGLLHIVGLLQSYGGENYTSGRIKTLGTYSFLYGRIAFRVKVPGGLGLWPAMWMMPLNSVYGPWAASGEMDVMESTGQLPDNVIGTIHFGGPYPDTAQSPGPSYNFIPGASLTNFNVYMFDWSTNAISWYINGWRYETQTNWWSSSNTNNTELNPYPAPFNEPFYIIMNMAIGGSYGGTVDNSVFPADLQIDYVRVYNLTSPLQLTPGRSGSKISLTWPSNIVCHLQSTTNLASGVWTNVTGAATPYSFTPQPGGAYYRLASP